MFAIILMFIVNTSLTQAENALICGLNVSLSSEKWGLQGEMFNVSLDVENVKQETDLLLSPSWNRLHISQNQFTITEDKTIEMNMTADHFYLYQLNVTCINKNITETAFFEVPVGRTLTENLVALIFQRIMSVFLALAMFLMGCELKFDIVRGYLRRPLAPIAGMFCQYVCMPVMAYLIGLAIIPDKFAMARYGLILVGSSPGGSFSNFWTALWGGDLDLSVTMTFCSTVASFGTTTFWVWLFGRFVLNADKNLSLPYLNLFISLASIVVPVFFGLLLTWWRPSWSARLIKLSRPLFMLMMVVVSTLGLYINRFFFTAVSWYDLVAPACLGMSGYLFGAIFSMILRLNRKQLIALSLETAIQNAGIAIVILQTNLPSPYGDMALMPVIGYLFTSSGLLNIVLYSFFRLFLLIRSCCGYENENEDLKNKNMSMKDRNNEAYLPE